jgi:CheY-like chemotaxis protein
MQVLVIDDDPDITWGLSKLIARLGHDSVSCGNAQSALEALALASPDLVLLDIELPEIDGYKLGCLLRENGLAAHRSSLSVATMMTQ